MSRRARIVSAVWYNDAKSAAGSAGVHAERRRRRGPFGFPAKGPQRIGPSDLMYDVITVSIE
jgi:hypothetical protein